MRIKKTIIIMLITLAFSLSLPAAAYSQDVLIKLARVLSYQKKYDESLSRYQEYLNTHPNDAPVYFEAADVASWAGNYALAQEYYLKGGADKASSDINARVRYARLLSYEKKYDEALSIFNNVLESEPSNIDALTDKAELLSWMQRYEESVDTYDQLLEIKFDPKAARQKARVLGWAKKYNKALRSYEEAYERSGDDNIRRERTAKRAYWNKWIRTSIKDYRELLESEPKNIEARFDLAQTEAYQRKWKAAKKDFERVLYEDKNHFRSSDSIAKLVEQTRPYVIPEINYFRAKSAEFETHIDQISSGLTLGESFNENLDVVGGYLYDYFHFADFSTIKRNRGKVGIGIYSPLNLWLNAAYIPIGYEDSGRFSHNFDTSLSSRPVDPILMSVFFKRDDMIWNHEVFVRRLRSTDAGAKVQADINRRWTVFADGAYSWFNDNNRRNAFGIENLVFLNYEPKRLTFDLRFDYYDFKYTRTYYWSPKGFWNLSSTLHWRQYLNRNGLYYGALDTYYGFKYRLNLDKNRNVYNGGAAEFHHDFSFKSSINMEVGGLYCPVYDELNAILTFTQRF